ncbi:ankyrin, partial [Glonium stellatum]
RAALQAVCNAYNASPELVQFLLSSGADVNAEAGIEGSLTVIQAAALRGHIMIVLLLLDAGADVSADPAERGRSAVDAAAEYGRLDMVQVLLNAGAKNRSAADLGYTRAIELAEENDHFAVAELL